jgi:ATP-dependent exoDNAse (exonuclease V) alpha subunit
MQGKRCKDKNRSILDGTKLPDIICFAIGAKVMVTSNINTDINVANGTRGKIVEVTLDPREAETVRWGPRITLRYPPCCILLKLERGNSSQVGNLPEGVVPIFPQERTYQLRFPGGKVKSVKQKQLPITGAYALTDYCAQGQTIERVIIDLATPPTGTLTPFSAYVALSRSSGRDTIRLLRGFDESLFTWPVCEALKQADSQFEELNQETMKRHGSSILM